jgi:hypothetical protein
MGALWFTILVCGVIAFVWALLTADWIVASLAAAVWSSASLPPVIIQPFRKWFLFFQFGCLLVIAYWLILPPSLGKGVVLLGLVAGLMSLHTDMKPWHRVVWIFIFSWAAFIEFKAIDRDHEDQRLLRQADSNTFQAIGNDIRTTLAGTQRIENAISDMSAGQQRFYRTAQSTSKRLAAVIGPVRTHSPSADELSGFASRLSDTLHGLPKQWEMDMTGVENMRYSDQINSHLTPQQHQTAEDDWASVRDERDSAWSRLLSSTVDDANLLRRVLLSQIPPTSQKPEDASEKAFADGYANSPCHSRSLGCTNELDKFGDYLVELANRAKAASGN